MSAQHPPLSLSDIETILTNLCFVERPPKSGTSHVTWVTLLPHEFRRVTVDPNEAPFTDNVLNWMIKQAGITRKAFYAARFSSSCQIKNHTRR
jgi:hypothetical protein